MKRVSFYQTFALNWLRKCWQTGDRWLIGWLMSDQPFVRARHFLHFSNERYRQNTFKLKTVPLESQTFFLKKKWKWTGWCNKLRPIDFFPFNNNGTKRPNKKGPRGTRHLKKSIGKSAVLFLFTLSPTRVPEVDSWPKRDQKEIPNFFPTRTATVRNIKPIRQKRSSVWRAAA